MNLKSDKILKWGRKIVGPFSNIQLILILLFVVIAFFIGENNVFVRFGNSLKIAELQSQIKYYKDETKKKPGKGYRTYFQ